MDNPEKLATQHWVHKAQTEDKQNKYTTQKTKMISNTDPTKDWGEIVCPLLLFLLGVTCPLIYGL